MTWPRVRIGEVLRLDLDKVAVDPSVTYPMVGVLSFGRGLFEREPVHGGGTSYRHFYRLKERHVVMSQLFGWEGALALGEPRFEGAYVSPQFPTFSCDERRLDRKFLGWYIRRKRFWDSLGARAVGMGDRRRTLTPDALLGQEMPLPPLADQRRIAARIEELSSRVSETHSLRMATLLERNALVIALAHRSDLGPAEKLARGWSGRQLSDLLKIASEPVRVSFTESYPNLGIYSFGRGLFRKAPIDGSTTSARELFRVHRDQFIYSRLFAFEGAYGLVADEFDGSLVSNEYPTFNCDETIALPEFLAAYFKSPGVWAVIATGSKGIGHRRQRVQPAQLLAHRLLVPPIDVQAAIRQMWKKLEELKAIQEKTEAKLAALMLSILDEAFEGEL